MPAGEMVCPWHAYTAGIHPYTVPAVHIHSTAVQQQPKQGQVASPCCPEGGVGKWSFLLQKQNETGS